MAKKSIKFDRKKFKKEIQNINQVFSSKDGAIVVLASTISSVVSVSLVQNYAIRNLTLFIFKALVLSGLIWFAFYFLFFMWCFWSNLLHFLFINIWPKKK